MASLFYLTGLTAPLAGYAVGRRSDRTGKRMGLFRLCVAAGFLGWSAMALASALWQPFVINLTIMALSAAASAQVFAALHDAQRMAPSESDDHVTAIVRMALTAGWVIGPVLGAWLAAALGLRLAFWATALIFLAQVLPLLRHQDVAAPAADVPKAPAARAPGLREMLPLLLFTLFFVMIYVGEPIKYGFLPIHMEQNLALPAPLRGGVIGVQPLVELILMPFAVPLAQRIGAIPAVGVAALMAMVANLCFGFWPSATGMFVGQVLMGGVWGIVFVLGILVAQRKLPHAVATASAVFMNAPPVGMALGGALGGLGVSGLGLPGVFILPALLAGLAALGLFALSVRDRVAL